MHTIVILLIALGGYLVGAIPLAYLITRLLTGRDIRRLGSGNIGVMNTIRQAGFPAGMLVFVGEGSKGAAAYSLGRSLGNNDERLVLLSGVAALIGVNWSIFVGLHGGRGTSLGTFFTALVAWKVVVLGGLVWLAAYLTFRETFLATRTTIVLFPLVAYAMTHNWAVLTAALAVTLILLTRHRRETDDRLQFAHSHAAVDDPGQRRKP